MNIEEQSIIDARTIFTLTHLKQFMQDLNDDDFVYIFSCTTNEELSYYTRKSTFFDALWSLKLSNDNDKDIIITSDNDIVLLTTEADITWWQKTAKRKAKLEAYMTADIEKKSKNAKVNAKVNANNVVRTVAVGSKDTSDHINDISSNCCNAYAAIEFINNEIRQRSLASFFKTEIMICLDYHDNENDVWKTIDELVVDGQIVLK